MSTFSKLTWLKRTDGHKFTGAEFRVLIALFNHSNADGTNAHPGLKLLAEETVYRKSGVSEAITSLKARGWIRETSRGSGYTGNASVFELVPDAPSSSAQPEQPDPSSSAVAEPPTEPSTSARPEQPTEVVPLERTSSSAVAEPVVPLERKPTDPDTRSGSDPLSSDPGEVRYAPNHSVGQGTGPEAGSLATAEPMTEATGVADGPDSDPWGSTSEPATESRPEGLQSATAHSAVATDDPFATPQPWQREQRTRKVRRDLQPATGYDDPFA